MIVTTTSTVEGRPIAEYKGIVSGTAIHGVNVGKDFKALGRNLVGGRAGAYEDEIDKGQNEAMAEMQKAAEELGANAVVGVSLDVEGRRQQRVDAAGHRVGHGRRRRAGLTSTSRARTSGCRSAAARSPCPAAGRPASGPCA